MLLSELINSESKLQQALEQNPSIVTYQDEDGMFILHHAAQLGLVLGSTSISKIFNVLFQAPSLDFSIKDNRCDTPLHIALRCCYDRVSCQYVFPYFLREASKRNFDFSTLDCQGLAVIHLATQLTYKDPQGISGRINNIAQIINVVPNIDVNIKSEYGATALYYAISALHFDEAFSLLDLGANSDFGHPDYDPAKLVDKYIDKYSEVPSVKSQLETLKKRLS